jgi:8-oxo-dGTP pyrophosphatase MutT (NUDIX family)
MQEIPTTFYRVSIKGLILDETHKKFAVVLEDNGLWELPGGGLDYPETPQDCLRREIKEEMGLSIAEINQNPSYLLFGKNMKGHQNINAVYEIKVKDLNFTPSEECREIRFISPEEIDSINAFSNVKQLASMFDSNNHKI